MTIPRARKPGDLVEHVRTHAQAFVTTAADERGYVIVRPLIGVPRREEWHVDDTKKV